MAFGHAVRRRGFDEKIKGDDGLMIGNDWTDEARAIGGDDLIRGGNSVNFITGLGGDDVINGRGGRDFLFGGDGEDDLSGGEGGDIDFLVGASAGTFIQDAYSDDFNAEATFEENGTDVIFGYDDDDGVGGTSPTNDDGVYDVIDFSDTINFVDQDSDGDVELDDKLTQLGNDLSYDVGTGQISYQGDAFFTVLDEESNAPGTVYVKVDGYHFQWQADTDMWIEVG